MNEPNTPHNSRELIETAAMDALGLLTADEREQFETTFRSAPPHIQAEVRREQLRTARAEQANLPDVAPPAWLKFNVLSAVRDAIHRATPTDPAAHREARILPFATGLSSTSAWRVAAVALASAAVTLGIFNISFRAQIDGLSDRLATLEGFDQMSRLGETFKDIVFTDDNTQTTLALNPDAQLPAATSGEPRARVLASATAQRCVVFVDNLPVLDANYRVVLLDDDGNIEREVRAFRATDAIQGLALDVTDDEITRLAIVGPTESVGEAPTIILAARFA